jgi:hypothetical protein
VPTHTTQPERYLVVPDAVSTQNLLDDPRHGEVLIDLRVRDGLEPSEMRLQDDFVLREGLRVLHRREAFDLSGKLLHGSIVGHDGKAGVQIQVIGSRKLLRVGQLDVHFGWCADFFGCREWHD